MRKIKFIGMFFALLFILSSADSSYLKVADRAEYARYVALCNTPVLKRVSFIGKLEVSKVNGQYTDSVGNYFAKVPIKAKWYNYDEKSITFDEDEVMIVTSAVVKVRRETPSVAQFYRNKAAGLKY